MNSLSGAHTKRNTAAAVFLALLPSGCGEPHAHAASEPQLVQVERRDVVDAVQATGRLRAQAQVAVMSRSSGIVERMLVEAGDRVRAGDLLAQLEREQLEAEALEQDAELNAAHAQLEAQRARIAELRVQLADPEPAFARRALERAVSLQADGVCSVESVDAARERAAQAEHRLALTSAKLAVLEAEGAALSCRVDSAAARARRTHTALRETSIFAPMDAVVLRRLREVGDGVSALSTAGGNATQLFVLGDLSRKLVDARVDEADLGRIQSTQRVELVFDAFKDLRFAGQIERVAPAGEVDASSIVTFEVRLIVEDPADQLRPEMTANVRFVLAERSGATALPVRTLRSAANGGREVVVVTQRSPLLTRTDAVKLLCSDGLWAALEGELAVGDSVLASDR